MEEATLSCCESGACMLGEAETERYLRIEGALLKHFLRRGHDEGAPLSPAERTSALQSLFSRPPGDLEAAVRSWIDDEAVYKTSNLSEEDLFLGRGLQHAVAGSFYVAEHRPAGSVVVKVPGDAQNHGKWQVLRVKSLSGECLSAGLAGRPAMVGTSIVPWCGHAVSLGCLALGGPVSFALGRVDLSTRTRLTLITHAAEVQGAVLTTTIPSPGRPARALAFKANGNARFKRAELGSALACYEAGMRLHAAPDLHSNAALMCLKLGDPSQAVAYCDSGLTIDPTHVKLLFRKASALLKMGRTRAASAVLQLLPESERHTAPVQELVEEIAVGKNGEEPRVPRPAWLQGSVLQRVLQFAPTRDAVALGMSSRGELNRVLECVEEVAIRRRLLPEGCVLTLPCCRNLRAVSLAGCRGVTDRLVAVILQQNRHLASLDVAGCASVTGATVRALLHHVRLQQPLSKMLPGMPASLSSLADLPPLPAASGGATDPLQKAPAKRRSRHRDALLRSPSALDPPAGKTLLQAVDLSKCDSVAPTEALDALALAISVTTTCRAADFCFCPMGTSDRLWKIALRKDWDAHRELDCDGRFAHFFREAPFKPSALGFFAMETDLAVDAAREHLKKLGLVEAQLNSLVG
ncbi:Serine/threonine-protein phosphatase T [Diplonema papillatum]|nr:Serine/threonine-protein phosphatase T [Diplonema papillatum]